MNGLIFLGVVYLIFRDQIDAAIFGGSAASPQQPGGAAPQHGGVRMPALPATHTGGQVPSLPGGGYPGGPGTDGPVVAVRQYPWPIPWPGEIPGHTEFPPELPPIWD